MLLSLNGGGDDVAAAESPWLFVALLLLCSSSASVACLSDAKTTSTLASCGPGTRRATVGPRACCSWGSFHPWGMSGTSSTWPSDTSPPFGPEPLSIPYAASIAA